MLPKNPKKIKAYRKRLSELASKRTGSKNPFFGKTHPLKGKHRKNETDEDLRQRKNKRMRDFYKTKKGRQFLAKHHKQRSGYGHHELSLKHLDCVWHHINKECVIQVPEHIHKSYSHKKPTPQLEGVLG